MPQATTPLCYHPTTVVLVDDNEDFLSFLKQSLNKKKIRCLTFSDPDQALAYLEGLPFKNKLAVACELHDDEDHMYDGKRIELNPKSIYKELYNPNRFSEVTIVVSDYDMPQMKGDTFFGTLSNRYIKRIMLTGEADHPLAIKLLNQKLINNFTEKKPLTTSEIIYQQILELQADYFNELSAPISEHLFDNNSYVTHQDYHDLVSSIIKEHNIVEHYTFSETGSKLMLDAQGNLLSLVIATEEDMDGYYDTASFAEVSDSIVSALKDKTHLPFLFTLEELENAPAHWAEQMTPVKKTLLNQTPVYYGISNAKKLKMDGVISFEHSQTNAK